MGVIMKDIVLESALVCPMCGARSVEIMPMDACVHFFECPGCKAILKPKEGDCCVFCSYGTVKCPSRQLADTE